MTTLKANLIYRDRSETVTGLCLFTNPQGLGGKLEHLFLSSMFVEITSRTVRLCLHEWLFLWSAKLPKPQRLLGVLCSFFFFSCSRKLCFRLRRLHVCHSVVIRGEAHHCKQHLGSTAAGKLVSSTFALFRLLSRHVGHTRCHTFPLAHAFCVILVLTASLKQQHWWMLGCRCTTQLCFFHRWCFSSHPPGCFFGFHYCSPLLCHRDPVL